MAELVGVEPDDVAELPSEMVEPLSRPRNIVFIIIEVLAVACGMGGADLAASLGQQFVVVGLYGVISGAFGGVIGTWR